MARLKLLALFLALSLFGCGSAFSVRSLDSGSLGDRYVNLIESQFALIAKSKSAADAVTRIEAYCAREAAAIEKIRSEGASLTDADGEAIGREIAPRLQDIMKRAESELEDKAFILADPSVLAAMAGCAPRSFGERTE